MSSSLSEITKNFSDNTSIHGIKRIGDESSILQKLFWTVSLLASVGMCTFQIYRLAIQFSSESTTTSVEMNYGPADLPVTIFCNINPLKFSKILDDAEFYQIINDTANHLGVNLTAYSKFKSMDRVHKPGSKIDFGLLENDVPNGPRYLFYIRKAFLRLNQYHVMFPMKGTLNIIRCSFRGQNCFEAITPIERFQYFYEECYKINLTSYGQVTSEGKSGGLELVLDIQKDEYIPFISDTTGVVLDIGTDIITANQIPLPSGFNINIVLKKSVVQRYAGRKEVCDPNPTYSNVAICLSRCFNEVAEELCGCTISFHEQITRKVCQDINDLICHESFAVPLDPISKCPHCKSPCQRDETLESFLRSQEHKLTFLNHFGTDDFVVFGERLDVLEPVLLSFITPFNKGTPWKRPSVHCNSIDGKSFTRETKYEKTISMTKWPSQTYLPVMTKIANQTIINSTYDVFDDKTIEDYVKINIFYASLLSTVSKEEASYTDENFVSDIGGQLGLWAGLSVLSLAEVVELFILILNWWCKWRGKRKKIQTVENKE